MGPAFMTHYCQDKEHISADLVSLMTAFADAPTRKLKLQILSTYVYRYPVRTLIKLHEPYVGVSKWQIKQARAHRKMKGLGSIPEKIISHRVRIDQGKLDHLLSFINRPYCYQDVAFGLRTMTLNSGEKLGMPNVICMVTRSIIVAHYQRYCEEERFVHKKMAAFVKTIAGFMFSVIRRTRNCSKTYSQEHLMRCEECERLKFVIKDIEDKIQIKCNNSSMTERRGDMLYDLKQAEKDIFEWKAHIMRSTKQKKGKEDVLQQLDENTILAIMDWAMKFQPRKYLDKQCEWFGKRGLSWHVTSVILKHDVNFTTRPTCGKLFKNKKLLRSEGNHFCSNDRQWFPYPHAKFKARFICEPISSGRTLQRHVLNPRKTFSAPGYIIPPLVNENHSIFHFQLNGDALWRWREVCRQPSTAFALLQQSILPFGYLINESAGERVGSALAESIRRFRRKNQHAKNMAKRKQMRAETWINLGERPEEIEESPKDVLAYLMEKNSNLSETVEENAADLCKKMRQRLAHSGKYYTEVGKKQQSDI
ncbi:hypothetical protein AWC38_SpisGene23731 [Stylophora pistillata]|uniref:Uncharacterized protein n=1 Tax=Stylophora pistillata TaxID=50429 RepID=A0A2B4R7X9_STYPI|nr:hypothetical protein AWC38_SpisGene23731 [Stylophora pistillata]